MKTRIEWCDFTWNPVWGCLRGCPYCYAKKMAWRFYNERAAAESVYRCGKLLVKLAKDIKAFKPVWFQQRFDIMLTAKPNIIFVNSMSDIEFWKPEWIEKVIEKIKQYPQHKFIFLTKDLNTAVYHKYDFPPNCYLGLTLTGDEKRKEIETNWNNPIINIEPYHRTLIGGVYSPNCKQVIIGLETNNKKAEHATVGDIKDIIKFAEIWEAKLFIKDNVYKHYPNLPKIQERL